MVLGIRTPLNILCNPSAFHFLELLHRVKTDAVRIVNVAIGIAHRHHLAAKLLRLLRRIQRHVAGTGHQDRLAG